MASQLNLYQFAQHDLVQFTDGREPHTLAEHAADWTWRGQVDATPEAIAEVVTTSPSTVLNAVLQNGYWMSAMGGVTDEWHRTHVL